MQALDLSGYSKHACTHGLSLWQTIFYILHCLKLKQEMCRVMGDKDVTILMKERMIDTWLPKILSYVQKSEKSSLKKLVEEMDSAISEDKLNPAGNIKCSLAFCILQFSILSHISPRVRIVSCKD